MTTSSFTRREEVVRGCQVPGGAGRISMKAAVIRGEQRDLDELIRIARSIGGHIYQERGDKIKVLGYGSVFLTSGETVKVVVLDNSGGRNRPGCVDGNMS